MHLTPSFESTLCPPPCSQTVYYWSAAQGFLGRAFAPIAMLEHAGAAYETKDAPERPSGTFAVPAVQTPKGAYVSQVAAVCHTLGHELGLAPSDYAADAKALQICCDSVDLVTEADKEGKLEGDRKTKWLAHFDGLVSPDAEPVYSDFALLQALAMGAVFKSSSLCVDDFPPNLKAWFEKMKATKGAQAVLAKGVDLAPGGGKLPF